MAAHRGLDDVGRLDADDGGLKRFRGGQPLADGSLEVLEHLVVEQGAERAGIRGCKGVDDRLERGPRAAFEFGPIETGIGGLDPGQAMRERVGGGRRLEILIVVRFRIQFRLDTGRAAVGQLYDIPLDLGLLTPFVPCYPAAGTGARSGGRERCAA